MMLVVIRIKLIFMIILMISINLFAIESKVTIKENITCKRSVKALIILLNIRFNKDAVKHKLDKKGKVYKSALIEFRKMLDFINSNRSNDFTIIPGKCVRLTYPNENLIIRTSNIKKAKGFIENFFDKIETSNYLDAHLSVNYLTDFNIESKSSYYRTSRQKEIKKIKDCVKKKIVNKKDIMEQKISDRYDKTCKLNHFDIIVKPIKSGHFFDTKSDDLELKKEIPYTSELVSIYECN
jgi:hypothetical protein